MQMLQQGSSKLAAGAARGKTLRGQTFHSSTRMHTARHHQMANAVPVVRAQTVNEVGLMSLQTAVPAQSAHSFQAQQIGYPQVFSGCECHSHSGIRLGFFPVRAASEVGMHFAIASRPMSPGVHRRSISLLLQRATFEAERGDISKARRLFQTHWLHPNHPPLLEAWAQFEASIGNERLATELVTRLEVPTAAVE